MFFTVALSALAALVPSALALDGPSMSLTNGRFVGLNNDDMKFEMYRGVPFAQPPVGDLRFRKARPVEPTGGDRDATVFPKACIQSPDNQDQSEDCLYMNIYRPYGTTEASGLPILVMIHGGSWQGGSTFGPGWDMLKRARDEGRPFIHIGIQYRLNAFGLLASEGMAQEDLNAALSDQQEALRFVKNNARQIGGDPDKVVLGGQSAGASGASLNWLYSNPEEKLFRGVYMSSGGPTQYPVNAVADYDLPDGPTTQLIRMAGCERESKQDSIQCLREKPIDELRQQTHAVMTRNGTAPGHVTTWPPCLDGLFVKDRNSKWMADGKFNKVPILSGRNRDEGTVFTPGDIHDEAGIRDMVTSVLIPPVIPDDKFAGLMAVLPSDPPSGSPYGTGDNLFGHDPTWKRAASAFGDWKYTTASIYSLRTAAAAGMDAWAYLWLPPSGDNGAAHGTDTGIIFSGNPPADPMGLAMQQGVIRFITDLNPNNEQTGKEWPNYKNGAFVMKFDKTENFIQSDDYRKPFNDYCIENFEAWKK